MAYWENVTSLAINPLCQIRWIIVKTDIEGKKSRVLLGGISLPFMYYSSSSPVSTVHVRWESFVRR